MSRTKKDRPGRKWSRTVPRWVNNVFVVRPERQRNRMKVREILLMTKDELEDAPEFDKGHLPNADWIWH